MKKIVEIGTLLLVFLLPWQTRWIFQQGIINGNPNEYLSLSIYVIDVFLLMLLVVKLLAVLKGYKNFQFPISNFQSIFKVKFLNDKKAQLLLVIFFLIIAFSFFWAENSMLVLQRLGWVLLAFFLAFSIAAFENKTKLLFCFIWGLILSAWLGIWQFFVQNAFANKWLGLSSHTAEDGGVSYLEIFNGNGQMIRHLRSYGSFDHPNIFGFVMVLGIILTLWLCYKRKNKKNINFFLYIALASFSAGLFSSISRSALLSLILAMFVIFFRIGFAKIIKPLVVIFLVLAMLCFCYPKLLFSRGDLSARLEQKSINERSVYFHQGREIIFENVFFGVGSGNYIQQLLRKNPQDSAWTYQPVHNVFLLVWAEVGFFAMLSMLASFLLLGIYAWKKGVFVFAIWLSLMPPLLLDHWLWDLHFGVILLGFVVGILISDKDSG